MHLGPSEESLGVTLAKSPLVNDSVSKQEIWLGMQAYFFTERILMLVFVNN